MIRIYGASDDLVEIDGIIYDEHGCYDHKKPIKITTSSGTIASIFYNGEWDIKVKNRGFDFIGLVSKLTNDDLEHVYPAEGCSSYSDVLLIEDTIDWVKIGSKVYKK